MHARLLMSYCFSVTKHEVVAESGEKTAIPCDCTPTSNHADDKGRAQKENRWNFPVSAWPPISRKKINNNQTIWS